jgi:hypothetical protein
MKMNDLVGTVMLGCVLICTYAQKRLGVAQKKWG